MWIYIVLGVLALVVILLCMPLVLTVSYTDRLQVSVRYLFFRFRLVPSKQKPHKKNKPNQPQKEKEKKPKEKGVFHNMVEKNGVAGTIQTLASAVMSLPGTVLGLLEGARVRKLRVTAGITGEDAARAAMRYGQVCAVFYPFYGWLDHHMKLIDPQVDLHADYSGEKPTFTFYGRLYVTAGPTVGRTLRGFITLVRALRGKQEKSS